MAYTVTLADTRSWLTDPLNPGGPAIRCGTRVGSALSWTQDGELVVYAGFRTELVSYDSLTGGMTVTFANLAAAQIAQLEAWRGRTLLLRRTTGQRFYGGFLTMTEPVANVAGSTPVFECEVPFQIVSYSDAV